MASPYKCKYIFGVLISIHTQTYILSRSHITSVRTFLALLVRIVKTLQFFYEKKTTNKSCTIAACGLLNGQKTNLRPKRLRSIRIFVFICLVFFNLAWEKESTAQKVVGLPGQASAQTWAVTLNLLHVWKSPSQPEVTSHLAVGRFLRRDTMETTKNVEKGTGEGAEVAAFGASQRHVFR